MGVLAEGVEQPVPVPRAPDGSRRGRLAVSLVAGAGAAGFAAFQLWQAGVGVPTRYPDTEQFVAVAGQPIASRAFVAGVRPPLVPLVWRLSGDAETFVIVQTCVFVAAWLCLAWVVSRWMPRPGLRLAAGAVVLGFACTRPITQWNRSLLSESLALSALALLFAAAILWAERPGAWRAAALVAAAALFAFARDSNAWVVALLAVVVAADALVRRSAAPRSAWLAVGGLAAVAALAIGASAVSQRDRTNVGNLLNARVFPYPDRVSWWERRGMPQAAAIEAAARNVRPRADEAPVVSWRVLERPRFRALADWVHANGRRVYLEWLATHPGYVLAEPLRRPERSAFADLGLTDYAPGDRTDAPLLTRLLFPPAWVALLVGTAAVAGCVRLRLGRDATFRAVVVLGGLGLVHMLLAWHGDGMESRRHGLVGNAQARLAVLLLVLVAVHAVAGRRGARTAAS